VNTFNGTVPGLKKNIDGNQNYWSLTYFHFKMDVALEPKLESLTQIQGSGNAGAENDTVKDTHVNFDMTPPSLRKRNVINYTEETDSNSKTKNLTTSALDVKCGDFLHQTNKEWHLSDKIKLECEAEAVNDSKKAKKKSSVVKIYKCEICAKEFPKVGTLNRHIREVHNKDKNRSSQHCTCTTCGKNFSRSDRLTTHMRIHAGDMPYKCQYCDKCWMFKSELTKHLLKVHKIKEPKVMDPIRENKVIKVKVRPQVYICDICNRTFKINPALTRHKLEVHTGETPFECEICHAKYKFFNSLNQHMKRAHTGEKLYKCEVKSCSQIFHNQSTLNAHKETHWTFCEHCNKSFFNRENLTEHKNRVHKGEEKPSAKDKPFKCKICGKCFRILGKLKEHSKIHDQTPGQKMFGCEICVKCFRTRDCINAHRKRHTDKNYKCNECGKMFKLNTCLKKTHGSTQI